VRRGHTENLPNLCRSVSEELVGSRSLSKAVGEEDNKLSWIGKPSGTTTAVTFFVGRASGRVTGAKGDYGGPGVCRACLVYGRCLVQLAMSRGD
jgi:hypothetical protein